MSEVWYEEVEASTELMQGDLIPNCPLISWKAEQVQLDGEGEATRLKAMVEPILADTVVMTQACDLEQGKVRNIVLCPHLSLQEYRSLWEEAMRGKSQNPTEKAWRNHCDDIRDAYVWNLAILNTGKTQSLSIEHRIVDFHEIYTVPRNFLESFLGQRGQKRLRLLPPYREHLSQAFARFLCVSDCLLQLRKVGSCARRIWRARPALQPAFQGRESGAITSIASLRGAEGGIIRTGG